MKLRASVGLNGNQSIGAYETISRLTVEDMVAGAFIGVVLITTLGIPQSAGALTISSTRDCDNNAVMNCGALDTAELRRGYTYAGVATIYNYFGISEKEVMDMASTAVATVA